jgi:hypothetical protein
MSVDKNQNHMYQTWGADKLVIDYSPVQSQRVIQEIMHDHAPRHDFKKQLDLHERIRNDVDYDDWEYGTEPSYGSSWKSS